MKSTICITWALVILIVSPLALAQDRFETLPGYDSYKLIRSSMNQLVKGGRISKIKWSDDGSTMQYVRSGENFKIDINTREITKSDAETASEERGGPNARQRRRGPGRGRQRNSETSPDGNWIARSVDWNLVIEKVDEDDPQRINVTTAGTRKHRFAKASWVYGEELSQNTAMWWSPDSTKLAYYELDETQVIDFFITKGLTKLHTDSAVEGYPKPGENNPIATLWIYDLATKKKIKVDTGDDAEQYIYQVRYSPDGSLLLYNKTNRHQNVLELMAADLDTGYSRVVLTETQETWQRNSPYIKFLKDQQTFIWETEKTGYKQYELRNLDGRLLKTLTHGNYPAGNILKIDEENGIMYYMAYSDSHPLNAQLHRVGLDGIGQTRLTKQSANHRIWLSPDLQTFVATYETTEVPPTTALFSIEGQRLATLGVSDSTQLQETGLTVPEMFECMAADGKTKLYGVLYKPSNFDPERKYPLIIDVYGGPLSQRVRNTFKAAYAYCEFGYVIAVIDNRGTGGRGKAFESAAYLKLGTVDLDDQVAGVKYLTERPYIDGDHVGIFGHSYGGYMSALAIVKHPDVFHVAVASSPVTDWRNYDTIYTERFMRTPEENSQGYEQGSCLTFADQLKGKLLLLHGMIDDNVHPNNSWQLVDKFQKAGKSFSMMFFPNSAHGIGGPANAIRWEFFCDHLIVDIDKAMKNAG
ncbi:MAG: DPP IV N-terminal domain-containing protein [Planctomycetes bacterium]|nr:DPP IV N-terminal domain-containing protein [Planctomycetota bacterium]